MTARPPSPTPTPESGGWTPGPWFAHGMMLRAPDPDEPDVPWLVANFNMGCCDSGVCEDEANLRLAAAAPELADADSDALDTLSKLRLDLIEENAALHAQRIAVIEQTMVGLIAALAKARGDVA